MPSCAPTTNVHGLPTEVRFEAHQLPSGKKATIPVLSFEQLEQYPLQTLKMKARNLVETIGESALPPLRGMSTQKQLINYILDVQISLCATIGVRVNAYNFGIPADWTDEDDQGYFGGGETALSTRARDCARVLSVLKAERSPMRASVDGSLPKNAENFLQADYRKPMQMIQPAHRELDHSAAIEVNQAEAAMGFQRSKARNQGSIRLG
jgi:hypothetical protein